MGFVALFSVNWTISLMYRGSLKTKFCVAVVSTSSLVQLVKIGFCLFSVTVESESETFISGNTCYISWTMFNSKLLYAWSRRNSLRCIEFPATWVQFMCTGHGKVNSFKVDFGKRGKPSSEARTGQGSQEKTTRAETHDHHQMESKNLFVIDILWELDSEPFVGNIEI